MAVFPEHHPLFVGNYLGEVGSARAREVMEAADCVLMLGALMTEVNTGVYTATGARSSRRSTRGCG